MTKRLRRRAESPEGMIEACELLATVAGPAAEKRSFLKGILT